MRNDCGKWLDIFGARVLPLRTNTLTECLLTLSTMQAYVPESTYLAFCTYKYDVVFSPLSIITETPPRSESKLIS